MPRPHKSTESALTLFSFQDIMCCLVGVLVLIALQLVLSGLNSQVRLERLNKNAEAAAAAALEAQAQARALQEELPALRAELAARQAGGAVSPQEVRVLEELAERGREQVERERERLAALHAEQMRLDEEFHRHAAEETRLKEQRLQAEHQVRRARVQWRPGQREARVPIFVEVTGAEVRLGDLDPSGAPVLRQRIEEPDLEQGVADALTGRDPQGGYVVFVVHADGIDRFQALRRKLFRLGFDAGWQLWDGVQGPFLEGQQP